MRRVFHRGLFPAGCALALLITPAGWVIADDITAPAAVATNATTSTAGPPRPSPVEMFRNLLAMSPAERTEALKIYPAGIKERIIAKLQEYELLPQPLRDLRLQVTELRWYLLPLLKQPPAERDRRLQLVPEPYHRLIAARLQEWDIWPPSLKEEVLDYESTMHYLVGRNAEAQPQMESQDLTEAERSALEEKLERWKTLPAPQRRQMYAAFKHYFELSDEEQEKTLAALSASERQETEKVVDPIEQWSKPQQENYLAAFQQFANMSAEERQQFMRNVERWRKMSEPERQAWRDLVKQLSNTPPLPPGFQPRPPAAGLSGSFPARTNPTTAPSR